MAGRRQPGAGKPSGDVLPVATDELYLTALGYKSVAGMDEVGRGCLAGPVVAAAVILKPEAYEFTGRMVEIRDSKLLSPEMREELSHEIERLARGVGVGVVPHDFVDAHGIVEATRQAMALAVANLPARPDYLLIDYLSLPAVCLPQKPVLYGDSLCLSIAAASIVAKVYRDRLMVAQHTFFPGYGFVSNKGYGTPAHLESLRRLGPCAIHRRSFAPVRNCLEG
ncbi:MAG: ribonuclease HII [Chloroflexi bacterium]|nr:ribonuclease HII [Chloroflexota bacterium]